MLAIQNTRTGEVLADKVEIALTRAARRRGLLGRDSLDDSAALILSPCCAVHTAFMRFPIDVIFLDHQDTIVHIVEELVPWRVAVSMFAHTTIEFASGTLRWRDLVVGDRLCLAAATAETAAAG